MVFLDFHFHFTFPVFIKGDKEPKDYEKHASIDLVIYK